MPILVAGGGKPAVLCQVGDEGRGAQPHLWSHPIQELLGGYHHRHLRLPGAAALRWLGGGRPLQGLLVGSGQYGGAPYRLVRPQWIRPAASCW